MERNDPAPLALLAWIARCRRLGLSDEDLAVEVDLEPAWLEDPRLARIEARFTRARAPSPAGPAAGPNARLEAAVEQLLAQGRVAEAARLRRGIEPSGRRAARTDPSASPSAEFDLEAELAAAGPEFRALWDAYGYDSWVVPPGCGRRPLASLTAEWVTPADRWRVLEELRRVDDPAERARVLAHFEKAGLDPGLDHPAFARADVTSSEAAPGPGSDRPVPPSPVAAGHLPGHPASPDHPAPRVVGSPAGHDEGKDSAIQSAATDGGEPARDPALVAYLRRLGEEADAYHSVARRRQAAEAWKRHARELGVPVPPHARLDDTLDPRLESAPAEASHAPAPPEPALAWPDGLGPRPSEPMPDWPWSRGEGEPPTRAAERAARAPHPAPTGKTSRPRSPPSSAAGTPADRRGSAPEAVAQPDEALSSDPPGATRVRRRRTRGAASGSSRPATPPRGSAHEAPPAAPVVWAREPLGPNRLARLRGDHPWWL